MAKDGDGCDALGTSYLEGKGVPTDGKKALELFQIGCDYDSWSSCNSLGTVYRDGLDGIPFDKAQAKVVFDKACKGGLTEACDAMKPKRPAEGSSCSGYGSWGEVCGGVRVNTYKSNQHCGECNHACEGATFCIDALCR